MSSIESGRRPALGRVGAMCLIAGLLALAPSAAQAHVMSKGKATSTARAVSAVSAQELDGTTLTDGAVVSVTDYAWGRCTRRNAHRFLCLIGVQGTITHPTGAVADFACIRQISVSHRNHRSRRVTVGFVGEPACEVAPRAAAARAHSSSAQAALERAVARAFDRATH